MNELRSQPFTLTTTYIKAARIQLEIAKYVDGKIALLGISANRGERAFSVSINTFKPTPDVDGMPTIWAKGYSENEGIPEALERLGLIQRVPSSPGIETEVKLGFVTSNLYRICLDCPMWTQETAP